MRKILLILAILITVNVISQTKEYIITTENRCYYKTTEDSIEFISCEEQLGTFEFSNNNKILKHTTKNTQEIYYIDTLIKKDNIYSTLLSTNDNTFYLEMSLINKTMRFAYYKDKDVMVITFKIKKYKQK